MGRTLSAHQSPVLMSEWKTPILSALPRRRRFPATKGFRSAAVALAPRPLKPPDIHVLYRRRSRQQARTQLRPPLDARSGVDGARAQVLVPGRLAAFRAM